MNFQLCTIFSLSVKVKKKSQGNRKGILFLEGKQLINTVANFQIT